MELTEQQARAVDALVDWLPGKGQRDVFRIFGYAGTGKTTVAKYLGEAAGVRVAYCAYTGKAASRMRRVGCSGATTIHQAIYQPIPGRDGEPPQFERRRQSTFGNADLVCIDECSMVSEETAEDLMSFGLPILVLGDPAQLPPIEGCGYFDQAKPDVMLTEVHRQAADSGILRLATYVRSGKEVRNLVGRGVADCEVVGRPDEERVLAADQILVGFNKMRVRLNQWVRRRRGFDGPYPNPGERVVTMRNNHDLGVLNGDTWDVIECVFDEKTDFLELSLSSETDEGRSARILGHAATFRGEEIHPWKSREAMPLDFAYAMTVHKAQGSGWDNVVLFDHSRGFERMRSGDGRRWLYTGVTRAAERLTVACA